MNFQQLRHFVVAAQTGNLIKAAQVLHISQSGLSRSISALEHQMGLALFERGPKGIALTDFGRHFLPGAQVMLNEHRRYVEQLRDFHELRAGSLALGISNSFAHIIAPRAAVALLGDWPRVSLSMVTDHYHALVAQLLTGELDMALSLYTERDMHDELSYERLCDLAMAVLCRPDHPLLAAGEAGVEDLAQAGWAMIGGESAHGQFSLFFEEAGVARPTIAFQCTSAPLLASLVAGTDLLTVLPEELLRGGLPAGLVRLPTVGSFGAHHVGLIRRRGAGETPIAAKLTTEIRRSVRHMQNPQSPL